MENLKSLKEQLGQLDKEINSLTEVVSRENRSFNEDEKNEVLSRETQRDELKNKIDTLEIIERNRKPNVQVAKNAQVFGKATVEDEDMVFRAWALKASGQDHLINDRMQRSVDVCRANINNSTLVVRAQTIGTTTEGGHTTNGSLHQGIEAQLKAYGGMRSVAKVVKTENGSPIHWSTIDDTANVGAIVGENTNVSNTALTFGKVSLGAFKYGSGVYPVSLELLQDSQVDIAGLVAEDLGTRLARVQNTHFTTGAGTTLPYGFITDATLGKTAASATAVTFAEIIDLYHSVDAAYRGQAQFMMNDAVLAYLRKLEDSTNRPLFIDYANGGSMKLLGKDIVINNDMDSAMTTGKKIIAFGDFSKYVVRDVSSIEVKVLRELYALDGSVAFCAFSRADGRLTNVKAVKYLQLG